jgi:hypothetical protein
MESTSKPTRQHRSESEIRKIIKEFEASNLTFSEFCRQHSLGKQTFYNWRNRYRYKAATTARFVQMELDSSACSGVFAELELDGKLLRFFQALPAEFFKTLL